MFRFQIERSAAVFRRNGDGGEDCECRDVALDLWHGGRAGRKGRQEGL